jgi:hypothetical protein
MGKHVTICRNAETNVFIENESLGRRYYHPKVLFSQNEKCDHIIKEETINDGRKVVGDDDYLTRQPPPVC